MSGLARPIYATVVAQVADGIVIAPQSHDGCNASGFCSARIFQWWNSGPAELHLPVPNPEAYAPGQRIGIVVTPTEQLRLATWQFGGGLAALLAGLALGLAVGGPLAGLVGALASVVGAFMLIGRLRAAQPRIRIRALPAQLNPEQHSDGTFTDAVHS